MPEIGWLCFKCEQKTTMPTNKIIGIQSELRRVIPKVTGCKDYADEELLLVRMDQILRRSGVEALFVRLSVQAWEERGQQSSCSGELVRSGPEALDRHCRRSEQALRCTVLKQHLGMSYREVSKALAMSPLYRWFCRTRDFEAVKVPGKSTLQDYAHWLPQEKMEQVLAQLSAALCSEESAREIGLENELDAEVAWVDSTCLKAAIHFPTDWVLMRDGVRTLIKSVLVIRRHGLRKRITDPEGLLAEINGLSMSMSAQSRRKPGAKSQRKSLVRAMKRVCRIVSQHGNRYRQALDQHWRETDLTRKQAEVILRRMDNVLEQLPEAMRQAHERIIGERPVRSDQKILSLYESEIHVIVRGKAGADVEFGNTLHISETSEGYILDAVLLRERSPGDAKLLQARYAAIKAHTSGRLCGIVADKGYHSLACQTLLEKEGAYNGIRVPHRKGTESTEDEIWKGAQKRRAQTEGRIAILKNTFLNGTPRSKGFENRSLQVSWAVLAHNLWIAARLKWRKADPLHKAAA